MQAIRNFIEGIFGAAAGSVIIGIYVSMAIGGLYWLWIAIQIGSFGMFLVLLFPPALLLAAPIGMYSLVFGVPDWIIRIFG
jgi:hypothetical protein